MPYGGVVTQSTSLICQSVRQTPNEVTVTSCYLSLNFSWIKPFPECGTATFFMVTVRKMIVMTSVRRENKSVWIASSLASVRLKFRDAHCSLFVEQTGNECGLCSELHFIMFYFKCTIAQFKCIRGWFKFETLASKWIVKRWTEYCIWAPLLDIWAQLNRHSPVQKLKSTYIFIYFNDSNIIPTLCHITTLRVKVIKKEVGHTPPSPPFLLAKKKKGKKKTWRT